MNSEMNAVSFLNKIFTNSLNELKTTFPKLAETGFC